MDFSCKYNTKVPAVKRIMLEACELKDPTEEYSAFPLEDNIFEWHFTIKGAPETDYENGMYHGRILLPNDYPMKPPHIILLTPNGRFEINKKICLSISGFHPETWVPSWSIRTALLALIAFLPTPGKGTIGSINYTAEEKKILAEKSQSWKCPQCGPICDLFGSNSMTVSSSESQLIQSVVFKGEENSKSNEQENSTESETNKNINGGSLPAEENANATSERSSQLSEFSISDRNCNVLIAVIVLIIALLAFRRLFLM